MEEKYLNKIKQIFKPEYFVVFAVYDGGDKYLFGIKNKKYMNEPPLDPWYTIDKKTLEIKGFLPHEDKEFFKRATQNKVL